MEKRAKLILLFIFAACVSASANMTQKQEFSGLSGGYHNLTFNKFSDADGTLNSVKITFSLTISGGKLILDNDGSSAVSGTLEFGYDADITSANVSLPSSAITNNVFYSQGFNLAANTGDVPGDYDAASPDGLQYNGGSKNGVAEGYVSSSLYSSYRGNGNYIITVNLITRLECGEPTDLEYRTIENVYPAGYVEVIYNYTQAPEPATIVLLCAGAAFVVLESKTKRR
jgi:hypothetical protein